MAPTQCASVHNYVVRIINPAQKSKYITKVWHNVTEKFVSASALKQRLLDTFEEKLPPISELECGYLEKRTNAKRWIEHDEDVKALYKAFSPTDDIMLWCEGQRHEQPQNRAGKKRKDTESDTDDYPSRKRSRHEEQVNAVAEELRGLHKDKYTGPQLRLWARMKVNGQHNSTLNPPSIPLFTATVPSKSRHEPLTEALTSAATAVAGLLSQKGNTAASGSTSAATISHAERASISGQYLELLET